MKQLYPNLPFPLAVAPEFREHVLSIYYRLANRLDYWMLFQHMALGTFLEEDTGRTIIPGQLVKSITRYCGLGAIRNVGDYLAAFQSVVPFEVFDYRYTANEARTCSPMIDESILDAICCGVHRPHGTGAVWLATGELVSDRSRQMECHRREDILREVAYGAPADLPTYELLRHLTDTPQSVLRCICKSNWPMVNRAIESMPTSTEKERRCLEYCQRIAVHIETFDRVFYHVVPNSLRLFSTGTTLNQLPRDLRMKLLEGCIEIDLSACQLAIIAKVWGIKRLRSLLESGKSIWRSLLDYIGLDESHKDTIKHIAVYRIVFGGLKSTVEAKLLDAGLTTTQVDRFFSHPIIRDILAARDAALQRICYDGGGFDAYDRWMPWTPPTRRKSSLDFGGNRFRATKCSSCYLSCRPLNAIRTSNVYPGCTTARRYVLAMPPRCCDTSTGCKRTFIASRIDPRYPNVA